MSLLDDAIGKAETLLQDLKDTRDALRSEIGYDAPETLGLDKAAPAPAETPPASDAEQVKTAEEGHDNSLPFKCPACGATYAEQVPCTNGHPAEQTLPTADVLAGGAPATAAPGETAVPPPPPPVEVTATPDGSPSGSSPTTEPSSGGAASGPQWPAG